MDFLFSFVNFLQPGVLWPELASYRPMLIIALVAGVLGVFRESKYLRSDAFGHSTFIFLGLFILAQILSTYYSGIWSMLDEFNYWYIYPLFVAISILLINSPTALKRYIWGMMVGSMVVVFYGIYAVVAGLPAAVGGRAGAYGMYENHNDYSFIIVMVLPFIYMYRKISVGGVERLLLTASMFGCIGGMFFSLSRGGILALVLEFGLIITNTVAKERRLGLLFILAIFGAAAIGYQWAMREANQGSSYTADDAEASRFELWQAGMNMVLDKPLLGVGSRRFGENAANYGEISHDNLGKVSHNTYIEVISTSGLLGFIPFVLMLRSMWRALKEPTDSKDFPWIEATGKAALIALYVIMFRALLDAKPHDWSFYLFASIAIAYSGLRQQKASA